MEVSHGWPIQQTKLCQLQLQLLSIEGDKINKSNNRTRSIWGHHGNMEITVYGISGQKESGCNLNKSLRLNNTSLDSTWLMLLKYFCARVPTNKNTPHLFKITLYPFSKLHCTLDILYWFKKWKVSCTSLVSLVFSLGLSGRGSQD